MDNKISTKNKKNTMEIKINIILLIITTPIGIYEIIKMIKEKKKLEYKKTKEIVKLLEKIKLKEEKKEKERIELIRRGRKLIEKYEKRIKND